MFGSIHVDVFCLQSFSTYTCLGLVLCIRVYSTTVFEPCMIFWQGNCHSKTTEQGLNAQLDKGIDDRDIFPRLKSSEARFTTIILPTSTRLPQPASPAGKSCSNKEKDPWKRRRFKYSSSPINNADGELLLSYVYCVDWVLKRQHSCLLFHLWYK